MKKIYTKIMLIGLSCLCLLLGLNKQLNASSDEVTIYYTNDIHTYVDKDITYSLLATLKNNTPNSLLVDAGDHTQGTAYGSMDKGETLVKIMNETGYDVATLGNHEFDYGMTGCLNTVEKANYQYLSCNFYHEENGEFKDLVLDGYFISEVNNLKIAFIGITTPETFTSSTPAYFQDEDGNYIYGILGGNDGKELYDAVQNTIDEVSSKADIIIALGHLGIDQTSAPWRSEDVIKNTTGLDAFIDGHSHSTVPMKEVEDKLGNKVVLTQTGEYFNAVGKMTIVNNTIKTELLKKEDLKDITPNEKVKSLEKSLIEEIDNKLGQKIGFSKVTLDNYDENNNRLVRSQETNTGDFVTDALYYLFDNMDMDVDVAIMNSGGIRNKKISGDITYKTCKEIHTFGNVACLQKVTGQQILDALEWGAKDVGISESGGFLQVSGLTYKIDTSIPDTTRKDEKGVWCGSPTGEYRVYDVKIYNKEIDKWDDLNLEKTYNLARYNYTLRDLGDGYAMFDGAINILDYVMEDYMVIANYVQGFENGIVDNNSPLQKKYKNFNINYESVSGSSRITFESKPITEVNNNLYFIALGVIIILTGTLVIIYLISNKKQKS